MRRIKQKYQRIMKYWRISYQQANGRDRLLLGVYALIVLTYMWWAILAI